MSCAFRDTNTFLKSISINCESPGRDEIFCFTESAMLLNAVPIEVMFSLESKRHDDQSACDANAAHCSHPDPER